MIHMPSAAIVVVTSFFIHFCSSDVCNYPDSKYIAARYKDVLTWDYPNIVNQITSFTDSPLPIIILHTTVTETPSNTEYDPAFITVIDNSMGMRNSLLDTPTYQGPAKFRMRGQSTRIEYPKKQFAVELLNGERTDSTDYALLGLPEESDWVFNAPYGDLSLMKNSLMYNVVRNIFNQSYAPRFRYFELFMVRGATGNTDPPVTFTHYEGLYMLLEKIKRGKDRVDISKLKASDLIGTKITGGYIFSMDKIKAGDNLICSGSRSVGGTADQQLQIGYPNPKNISAAQSLWLESYILELDQKTANYNKDGYSEYIDVLSFADYMWIQDIVANGDAFFSSFYFYKDQNKKIRAGPTWDHNYGLGSSYTITRSPSWALDKTCQSQTTLCFPTWFKNFMKDPNFFCAWKQRWLDLTGTGNLLQSMLQFIDQQAALISEPAARNFQRWPILSDNLWPNIKPLGTLTWEDHVCWLKSFVSNRIIWLTENIDSRNTRNFNCANLCAVELANDLLITEVMVTSERQWVEFYNPSANDISLQGYYFTDKNTVDHRIYFSDETLIQAKKHLVVYLNDISASYERIPGFDQSDWKLGASDNVQVFNRCWQPLKKAIFSWQSDQVQVQDVSLGRCGQEIVSLYSPTPGETNACNQCPEQNLTSLYINEINADGDWIEFYNPEKIPQNMGRFFLADENPKHRINLPNIEIQPNQFWVFQLNASSQFGFGKTKDEAKLQTQNCGSVIDATSWDFTLEGIGMTNYSWMRCPDSRVFYNLDQNDAQFVKLTQTKNMSNQKACSQVVIPTSNAFHLEYYSAMILLWFAAVNVL